MISSFHVRNFKSYREATLPLAPLTLLIGANASGKSNAIEALRLLSLLAQGLQIEEILSIIQSSDRVIRGNAHDLPRDGSAPVTLGCELESAEWRRMEIALKLREPACIQDETIISTGGHALYALGSSSVLDGDHRVSFSAPPFQGRRYVVVSNRRAVFPRLESLLGTPGERENGLDDLVRSVGAAFRRDLDRVLFFDPQPQRMRGYSYQGERVLNEDGSNISSVLLHLCADQGHAPAVLRFVSELPEQPFTDVGFIKTERGDVMVRLTERYGHHAEVRDAPVLSDGTLRVLGIAAALLSAEAGSTVVIEEIDNGVHPSRAETLLRNIEQVANERALRVLLTTHNPALLDRLSTDAIPHVVCAYRDPEDGDSRLVRLEDLPSYPELVARGPLGQLMTRGVLDYFLKHQESAQEKQERSQKWLNTLKAQVAET